MTETTPLALVTYALPADWTAMLQGNIRTIIAPPDSPGFSPELQAHFGEAQGLLSMLVHPVDAALLDRMPNLKVVSNMAVGVDNIDVAACTARGIPVGHTPGVLTAATADMAIALLISAARGIPAASADAREGRWDIWSPTGWLGADLQGTMLGVVGLGKIGTAIAERAVAFGMRIAYTSRSQKRQAEDHLGAVSLPLDDLLHQSDFVVLAVDLNKTTRGLIGEHELAMMKESAVLINIARGAVIQTGPLVAALREKRIAGAALDVTDPEPLPPDHPLYALPNCLITPHIASATWGTRKMMAELACQNLLAGMRGERLPHCVNPEVYEIF